jgi:hypothetical protein
MGLELLRKYKEKRPTDPTCFKLITTDSLRAFATNISKVDDEDSYFGNFPFGNLSMSERTPGERTNPPGLCLSRCKRKINHITRVLIK